MYIFAYKVLLYMLRAFANNLEAAESLLIIEDKDFDAATQLPITQFKLKDTYTGLDPDYHIKQYI